MAEIAAQPLAAARALMLGAVAGQVRRWARALGIGILEASAAELC